MVKYSLSWLGLLCAVAMAHASSSDLRSEKAHRHRDNISSPYKICGCFPRGHIKHNPLVILDSVLPESKVAFIKHIIKTARELLVIISKQLTMSKSVTQGLNGTQDAIQKNLIEIEVAKALWKFWQRLAIRLLSYLGGEASWGSARGGLFDLLSGLIPLNDHSKGLGVDLSVLRSHLNNSIHLLEGNGLDNFLSRSRGQGLDNGTWTGNFNIYNLSDIFKHSVFEPFEQFDFNKTKGFNFEIFPPGDQNAKVSEYYYLGRNDILPGNKNLSAEVDVKNRNWGGNGGGGRWSKWSNWNRIPLGHSSESSGSSSSSSSSSDGDA